MTKTKITKAQLDLLAGRRPGSRVEILNLPGFRRFPARTVTAVTFRCRDASIAKALWFKGLLENDGVERASGTRRAILTEDGKSIHENQVRIGSKS